eukprot:m.44139 g.44139  ORF g.44139 m.44139 type:complete len:169 (+) comp10821_c0_seq2:24-530(+)
MHQHDYHHFLNLGVVLTAVAIMATSRVGRDGMLDDCAKYAVEPSRKAKLEQQLADKKAQLQSTETLGAHARKRLYQLQHECQEAKEQLQRSTEALRACRKRVELEAHLIQELQTANGVFDQKYEAGLLKFEAFSDYFVECCNFISRESRLRQAEDRAGLEELLGSSTK